MLDAGERTRLDAMRREPDRERFVLAATLARSALSSRLGVAPGTVVLDRTCAQCGAPHGRPVLAAPLSDLHLSITHSGRVVGVAVGRGVPVGLDVESLDAAGDVESLESTVLAPSERLALDRATASSPRDRTAAFLQLWTRKEALTKMVGVGITVPLGKVVVTGPDEPARCLEWPDAAVRPGGITLSDLDPPAPGHVAAVAAEHPAAVVTVNDGDALLAAID